MKKRMFKVLTHKVRGEYWHRVEQEVLNALKRGAQINEQVRKRFFWGPGNQMVTMLGSKGHSFSRWQASTELLKHVELRSQGKKFVQLLKMHSGYSSNVNKEDAAKRFCCAVVSALTAQGGNCAEVAGYTSHLVLLQGGLGDGYTRVQRIHLDGADHEITVVRHKDHKQEETRPAITLDAWIPAAQSCLEKHARWGIKQKSTWTLDLSKGPASQFDFEALDRELKDIARKLNSTVDDRVRKYIKDGISASVKYYCPDCKGKWTGKIQYTEFDRAIGGYVSKRRKCPRCGLDGNRLKFQGDETLRYKPPFTLPSDKGLNIEFIHNCGIHPYTNDGLIRDYRKLIKPNESRKNWVTRTGAEIVGERVTKYTRLKPTVYVVPYSTKEEIKSEDPDYKYWIDHNNTMRTFDWGRAFE